MSSDHRSPPHFVLAQDVLLSLPPDGHRASSWGVRQVPDENLKRYEKSLVKMFEVGHDWQGGRQAIAGVPCSVPVTKGATNLTEDGSSLN